MFDEDLLHPLFSERNYKRLADPSIPQYQGPSFPQDQGLGPWFSPIPSNLQYQDPSNAQAPLFSGPSIPQSSRPGIPPEPQGERCSFEPKEEVKVKGAKDRVEYFTQEFLEKKRLNPEDSWEYALTI